MLRLRVQRLTISGLAATSAIQKKKKQLNGASTFNSYFFYRQLLFLQPPGPIEVHAANLLEVRPPLCRKDQGPPQVTPRKPSASFRESSNKLLAPPMWTAPNPKP